jgi:hypothetical protein
MVHILSTLFLAPNYSKIISEVLCGAVANGADPFGGQEFCDRGLWGHPLLTNCGAANMFNPIGPWATC